MTSQPLDFEDLAARQARRDPMAAVTFRNDCPAATSELVESGNAAAFRGDPVLEQLRELRDSGRGDDRRANEDLVRGGRRISLAAYEEQLRAYLRAGGELPEGVRKP